MSETGDFESELDKLLAEDEARRLRAEETSFACRFLMERGIVTFDYSDPTVKPPLPELSLDDLDSEQDFLLIATSTKCKRTSESLLKY